VQSSGKTYGLISKRRLKTNLAPLRKTYTMDYTKKLAKLKQNKELITKPWETEQPPHFHPRVLNLSNTSITEEEREVLEKGLCYAIRRSITSNVNRTIIDIENILNNLDEQSQKGYRIIAFNKLKRMIVSNTTKSST
jgi:hypothetical protein